MHPGRLRHRRDAAAAHLQRLGPEQQPPLPLIQVRPQQPVQPRHPLADGLPVPVAIRHITNGRPSGAENLAYFDAHTKQVRGRHRILVIRQTGTTQDGRFARR